MWNNRAKANRRRHTQRRQRLKAKNPVFFRNRAAAGRKRSVEEETVDQGWADGVLENLIQQRTLELTEVNERLKLSVIRCQRLDGRLRESEELFRSIFEQANAGMNTITLEGRYLQVNPAFCEFVGYSRQELQRLTVFDLTHPEDQVATRERFDTIRDGVCEAFNYEKRFVRKDGRVIWGHVTSAWIFDDRRQPLYGIGLVQNVTDRKQAEAELKRTLLSAREARAKIACILKSVGDGLIVTSTDRRIALMNPSAEDLLGVSFEQMINRPIVDPYVRLQLPKGLLDVLQCGETEGRFEFELPDRASGKSRAVQAQMSLIRDQDDQHGGFITTLRDVSREREVDNMKTEFITTAAHELRTPLTSIRGFSEVLLTRDDLDSSQRQGMLHVINEQSEILSRIVNDLLDLARIESGLGFVLQKGPCDLSSLAAQATSQFSWTHDCHQFEVALAADDAVVHGDRAKLLQVLENVLSNAVKYSPRGGRVLITGQRQEDIFQMSIADQGIGMSDDQVERMFDKFYRADTSNSAIEGVGLGMNIVQEIIKAHGGRIWVESALGEGTVVHFTLPADTAGRV